MRGPGAARTTAALLATLLVAACGTVARRPQPPDLGKTMAAIAVSLVGSPYHFGGADTAGFDCSGLALYVHEQVGLSIPRTAREQQRAAHRVPLDRLAPGDLLFFHSRSRHVDHVGIYAGSGRFVHAPRAGVAVEYGDLDPGGYYRRRLVSAGRFWK
ncbi:MAG TPA: C40 family peptidase [Steroidobacteraceae bacterium]|nr:C40 family peptidase [Steroidobacteraceae bacterium]